MGLVQQVSFFLVLGLAVTTHARGLLPLNDNKSPVCDSCLMVLRILDDYLCDPSASDFLMDLFENQVCPLIGDKELCDNLATTLVPVALEWLHDAVTPEQMCSAVGVCGASVHGGRIVSKARQLRRQNSLECPLCEYILGGLQTILKDPTMELTIEQAAEKVCKNLPSNIALSCTNFVEAYEPILVAYIESMNASMACSLLGACPASLKAIKPAPLSPVLVQYLSTYVSKTHGPALVGPANDMCDTCKMSVIEAHSLVTDPTIQAEVIAYAKIMCDAAVPAQKDLCRSMVDAYAPMMFDQLAKVLLPDFLCVQLHLCKPSTVMDAVVSALRDNWQMFTSAKLFT